MQRKTTPAQRAKIERVKENKAGRKNLAIWAESLKPRPAPLLEPEITAEDAQLLLPLNLKEHFR